MATAHRGVTRGRLIVATTTTGYNDELCERKLSETQFKGEKQRKKGFILC
jgi:hypothetical protein